jgi:peptidoglycan-associated lipoprotein
MSRPITTLAKICILATLAATVAISGCRGPGSPDPSMTAVRSGSGGAGGDGFGDDWIQSQAVQAGGMDGLEARGMNGHGQDQGEANLDGMGPVFFDFDQSFIRPDDRPVLQQVATFLRANPSVEIIIEGHCDWRGTTEYNLALGERRAQSVRAYLEQLNVSAGQMEIRSKGDLDAMTEATEQQMQQDRRADLLFFR